LRVRQVRLVRHVIEVSDQFITGQDKQRR
jgi:hypothetical protein